MSPRSRQIALVLSLLVSATASSALAQTPPAAEPAAPAQAPTAPAPTASPAPPSGEASDSTGRVPAPPPGKGQVVFFRPSRLGGMAVSFSIHEGDAGVGKLGNGSYFVLVADPGPHTYTIESEAKDSLNVEVDAGETQYVQQSLGMGVLMAHPHLTPSDQATFDKLSLKPSTKKPTDLKSKTAG